MFRGFYTLAKQRLVALSSHGFVCWQCNSWDTRPSYEHRMWQAPETDDARQILSWTPGLLTNNKHCFLDQGESCPGPELSGHVQTFPSMAQGSRMVSQLACLIPLYFHWQLRGLPWTRSQTNPKSWTLPALAFLLFNLYIRPFQGLPSPLPSFFSLANWQHDYFFPKRVWCFE